MLLFGYNGGRELQTRLPFAQERKVTQVAKVKNDLDRSIKRWKKKNPDLAVSFEDGYESFKIGVLLKRTRQDAGVSQTELAAMINTKRTAISRLENHAQDVKLSTIEKVARALGKHVEVHIV